ncbi:MAG: phosphoribosylaminoimidazole-succinocarboxamide synthase [Glaciecola sp.]
MAIDHPPPEQQGRLVALDGLPHVRAGKVRDLYQPEDESQLLLVASDRISTFDVIHPTLVPDKGRVLTGVSTYWFEQTEDLVANHLVSTSLADFGDAAQAHGDHLAGRTMLTRKVEIVPFECVVRGYLVGSGWKEYGQDGTVCGIPLPGGLEQAAKLEEPIFTPATKAEIGEHDENVSFDRMVTDLGSPLSQKLRELSLALYSRGRDLAAERGIILADTKFEFGIVDGEVLLADEVLTMDSSRYWPAEQYKTGSNPPSFDKQFVRDYATSTGWDMNPPAPSLPDDVVGQTRAKYIEAYERITERPFDAWLAAR